MESSEFPIKLGQAELVDMQRMLEVFDFVTFNGYNHPLAVLKIPRFSVTVSWYDREKSLGVRFADGMLETFNLTGMPTMAEIREILKSILVWEE